VAISGAAASPNMGTTTVKPLVFILTILNIRLGYWLPNPKIVRACHAVESFILGRGVSPQYLLKEATSRIDDSGSFVNVSDGGHIENLAIYQLLRRRCKFIISVDGEADPDMTYGGLVQLMRFARIDMGIVIDIDLSDIDKDKNGQSKKHWDTGYNSLWR